MDLKKAISYALSDHDVLKVVDGKANIITYPDLYRYKKLDDILKPYGSAFILYEWKPSFGHWISINKINPDTVEVFDSYGVLPDDELGWVPKKFIKKSNQDFTYLTELLYDSPYNIDYNHYKFQKKGSGISTCGRHAAMRILFKEMPLDEYYKVFGGVDSDELVTLFTMLIAHK
jgi:hypothetical protein